MTSAKSLLCDAPSVEDGAMVSLWRLEPATAAKHRLYKRYLDAWWPILLQPTRTGFLRPKVTYVDAFAGPGRYRDGEEGSPVFALDRLLNHSSVDQMHLSRQRVSLIFIERDRDFFEHLLGELTGRFGKLEDLPVRVVVRHGEAAHVTGAVLDEFSAWGHPILAIFDSWGNVNVPLTLIRRIAHNPASEVIITFGPNWFSRREALDPTELDAVFGGREFWQPAEAELRADERWRVWLKTYREALRRAGFQYQLNFEVVPSTGLPLHLVYGTRHPKGVEEMKDAMWAVDGQDGMGFRDPRTRGAIPIGQSGLWPATDINGEELRELVVQRLTSGPASLDEIGEWLKLESARWRARDARPVVLGLQADGVIARAGGRLTGTSIISLF
jgi:three-Cys-motif partner protein